MFASVRWNDALLNPMFIESSVMQSSILFPNLFNMYVNVIIDMLIKSG